jgi:hypothetical protein
VQARHGRYHEAWALHAADKCLLPLLLECVMRIEVQMHGRLVCLVSVQ